MNKEKSEFGKGLVICLVKFSAHFFNEYMDKLSILRKYYESNKRQRKLMLQENPPSYINYGKRYHEDLRVMIHQLLPIYENNLDKYISYEISMWANGASDHLYEIEVPENKGWDKIRAKVDKLQSIGLEMGHGFVENKIYTFSDLDKLKELTNKICLMIDKKIGLEPDIGEWS